MGTKHRARQGTTVRNGVQNGSRKDTGRSSRSDTNDEGLQDIRKQLAGHAADLRVVVGSISLCTRALHDQNADQDRDIAEVLERTANDKLYEMAGRLDALAFGIGYREP